MTNAEFYSKANELQEAHDAFREAAKDRMTATWVRHAVDNPYFYATKPADTALQAGLRVGSLVKVMVSLQGEGMYPHYAVVVETPVNDVNNEYVKYDTVVLRFANGSLYQFRVDGRIGAPMSDESQMKEGDIKACDIPAEFLNLALRNCPLKDERACMKKGIPEKGDERE